MMHPVYGHERLTERLGRSIAEERFPQAALFLGPPGVGKQRLALWAAQATLCETKTGSPCGSCASCIQVGGLAHPDLHWIVPLALKKKATDPDKQVDEVQSALVDVMAERRTTALYEPPDSAAAHSVAAVRLIHRIVAKKPYQGRHKVLIIGDAPRLVVQAGSLEAANALLKVLEEPPRDTFIFLTAESSQALIPTIRSRCTPVRVRPVSDEAVSRFAAEVGGLNAQEAAGVAGRAGGRCGAVAEVVKSDAESAANALIRALRRPEDYLALALKQAPFGARGGFSGFLDALSIRMRNRLAESAGQEDKDLRKPLQALKIIAKHKMLTRQNVNPQLAMAVMATELGRLR